MTQLIGKNATKAGAMLERFPNWLSRKNSPKWFMYWSGFLARDRVKYARVEPNNPDSKFTEQIEPNVDALAHMVYGAFKRRQVLLVQKKAGPGEYYYFAVKRR